MGISHWSRDRDLQRVDEAVAGLKKYIAELETKADAVTGKIMPVKYLGSAMGKRFSSLVDYDRNSWGSSRSKRRALPRAESHCKELWEQVLKDHEANVPAMENNQKLRERVALMMHNIGIPDKTTRQDWTGRRRNPKEVTDTAGYLLDLQKHCLIDDGFRAAEEAHKRFLADIERLRKEIETEEKEAERIKVQQETEQKREKVRAALAVKYGLDYTVELNEIVQHLIGKNKYLRLAHFLRLNRNDWNDGYSYAERGIYGFAVENETDKQISADIYAYFEDFEDGRVFRDCEWNYDRLFAIVEETEPELISDYQQAYDLAERF